ncbi:TonB-dependent receptor plug domain-containing protein [Parabacteroides sp. PF5-6]|uniref:TonB-dependent receptor plug domain-containing protein n=1 Tax=Parabacteroides sp. PF5-6 TaxID=1742403 RepID=UPI002407639F|nr:TonB-dependent receptor plug domain-containing protein [Parabacteroides sp. PF5-6]MDF9830550.1 hypothetical protein [Parabacteroides sp. PF5-6]
MRKQIVCVLIFICLVGSYSLSHAQNREMPDVQEKLIQQMELYPQEKLHLHTDRDYYMPKDSIWFKAYLVDAVTHIPSFGSRYIYVELINQTDSVVNRVSIHPVEQNYSGCLPLPENLVDGSYTLRAYTRYMENLGSEYFFRKPVYIGLNKDQTKESAAASKNFSVSFLPEGGYILDGVLCRVAFKAINDKGLSEPIQGMVYEEDGTPVHELTTQHAGMGMFAILPKAGKRYYAECIGSNGVRKRFDLPKVIEGYSLQTTWQEKNLHVKVVQSAAMKNKSPLYLLIHCRGMVFHFGQWDFRKEFISFSNDVFPSGILQIVLLDQQHNPISERLAFNFGNDSTHIELQTDKMVYSTREPVNISLQLTDFNGNPLVGDLSVAITDDLDVPAGSDYDMLSTLLLSTELKGHIESPGFYLQKEKKATNALDLLMMTQGWRRYDLSKVLQGEYTHPLIPFETGQRISGTVNKVKSNKTVPHAQIAFMALTADEDGWFTDETSADENGRFSLEGFELPDATEYVLHALNIKGGDWVELNIDSICYPTAKKDGYIPQSSNYVFSQAYVKRLEAAGNMWQIQLGEISVTVAKKTKRIFETAHPQALVSIGPELIERKKPVRLEDLFLGIPGVRVSEGKIYARATGTIMNIEDIRGEGSGAIEELPALILINDVPSYMSPFDILHVQDVERIEVYRLAAETAFWGKRGMNGVVNFITKQWTPEDAEHPIYNKINYTPLGYQHAIEFYTPVYDTPQQRSSSLPDLRTTLFWKPDLRTDEEGNAGFKFYTADQRGSYSIIIEGITADGGIVRKIEKVDIK